MQYLALVNFIMPLHKMPVNPWTCCHMVRGEWRPHIVAGGGVLVVVVGNLSPTKGIRHVVGAYHSKAAQRGWCDPQGDLVGGDDWVASIAGSRNVSEQWQVAFPRVLPMVLLVEGGRVPWIP